MRFGTSTLSPNAKSLGKHSAATDALNDMQTNARRFADADGSGDQLWAVQCSNAPPRSVMDHDC